jgi:hypothetical protein
MGRDQIAKMKNLARRLPIFFFLPQAKRSSRIKVAPQGERSLSEAVSALRSLRLGVKNFQI